MRPSTSTPPLSGIKVVEFAGLAPGPFAGLILADFGASVVRIDRHSRKDPRMQAAGEDVLCRRKRSIAVDIKTPQGLGIVQRLIRDADVLIDPFRPGVLEKAGLGPEAWLSQCGTEGKNEKLIFARLGGFNRNGFQRAMAGHDINYLAMSGILSMMPGAQGKPSFPLTLLADFAGGGLICTLGILMAVFERVRSGRGQVIDSDMVSGTRYLSTLPFFHATLHSPNFSSTGSLPGSNLLDGGAPFYSLYTCADGKHVAVGCLEPQFFRCFLDGFLRALPPNYRAYEGWTPTPDVQGRKETWKRLRTFMERGFRTQSRDAWSTLFDGTDACVTPVLTPSEAAVVAARGTLSSAFFAPLLSAKSSQMSIATPAPLLSRTPAAPFSGSLHVLSPGQHTEELLGELGFDAESIAGLVEKSIVGVAREGEGHGLGAKL
ncbi:CoA-transferase family III [Amylostereum chailletii]|nr:CoA-transferase family III [Amylostereum chailletii]